MPCDPWVLKCKMVPPTGSLDPVFLPAIGDRIGVVLDQQQRVAAHCGERKEAAVLIPGHPTVLAGDTAQAPSIAPRLNIIPAAIVRDNELVSRSCQRCDPIN